MEVKLYYNVLVKDGNRTVNWDFNVNSTVRQVLQKFRWVWRPNTIKVNGKPLKNNQLDISLADLICGKDGTKPKNNERVTITLIAPPEQKKPAKAAAKEDENVH